MLVRIVVSAALAVVGILAAGSSVGSAAEKPNIVMIISDDQAWGDYGFMGHDVIQTPNLDRLASQSAVFGRGYVPTALCRPSLMTMITGHYASVHGVTGNDPSPKYAERDSELYSQRRAELIAKIDQFETLPELLVEQGYVCHQSGKWWEGNFSRGGFTDGMTRGFPQRGGRHGDDGLKIGRDTMQPVEAFIDSAVADEKPFFIWYAPFLPHTPHNPPQRILSKYKNPGLADSVAKYYAMCEWFDETCGQLLQHVDDAGVRENTVVVYVTDNGWIQDPNSGKYAPRSKQTAYEGGIRTPILYSWPGEIQAGERSELATSLDLYPTLAAIAGAKSPDGLPGLNLLEQLKSGEQIDRERIFGESFAHDIADVNDPKKTLLYRWCIEGDWKLLLSYDGEVNRYKTTHPRDAGGPELFNLSDDPWEKQNVAAEHPEVVKQLRDAIEAWYPSAPRQEL